MTFTFRVRDDVPATRTLASDDPAHGCRASAGVAIAMGALALIATFWLGYELFRFLARPTHIGPVAIHPGALDLVYLHEMVRAWWSGTPVYSGPGAALHNYPPESMVFLAPIYGWPSESVTIGVWLTTFVAALALLTARLVRECGARTGAERLGAALVVVASYPVGATLGNGQIGVHILLAVVIALLQMRDYPPSWRRDAAVAALLLFALSKPTIAAPFVLVALVSPGGMRVVAIVVTGYAALTLAAATSQAETLSSLLGQFVARGWSQAMHGGESNLHRLLAGADLAEWMPHASIAAAALLGALLVRLRRADPWLLIGVTAVVARFWTYHRWYDDLLILLPLLALAKIAFDASSPRRDRTAARALAFATVLLLLAPGGLYLLPTPWSTIYRYLQVAAWIGGAALLAGRAWRTTGRIPPAVGISG